MKEYYLDFNSLHFLFPGTLGKYTLRPKNRPKNYLRRNTENTINPTASRFLQCWHEFDCTDFLAQFSRFRTRSGNDFVDLNFAFVSSVKPSGSDNGCTSTISIQYFLLFERFVSDFFSANIKREITKNLGIEDNIYKEFWNL